MRSGVRYAVVAVILAGVAAVAIFAIASGDGDDGDADAPTPTETTDGRTPDPDGSDPDGGGGGDGDGDGVDGAQGGSGSIPSDDDRADVVADFMAADQAFLDALVDPIQLGSDAVETTHTFAMAGRVNAYLQGFLDDGWRVERSPADIENSVVIGVTFDSDDDATLRVCTVSDLIVVDAESDAVIDDSLTTTEYVATMVRDGGRWLLNTNDEIQTWEGVAGCAN